MEVQSRILQIVVDPDQYIAKVYTHDQQLLATLTLGEGRQRFEPAKDESLLPRGLYNGVDFEQNRIRQLERETENMRQQMEEAKRQLESMKQQQQQQQPQQTTS